MRGRHFIWALPLLLGLSLPPRAEAAVDVQIGINVSTYPDLQPIPGYPVYYAPGMYANYFFYDGLYWVYVDDNWYSSSWYNGPWYWAEPAFVPVYILRVPVSYYRAPPVYFRAWTPTEPPRWGAHWGPQWEAQHRGWNQWDRRQAPPPAPLPVYQRQYTGDRYPPREQQQTIREQQYRFVPRDETVRQRLAAEPRSQPVAQRPGIPAPRGADSDRAAQTPQPQQREARERDVQQQQQEARQRQQQAQQRAEQQVDQQRAQDRQAREREQAQARQQEQQQQMRQQDQQARQRQQEQQARQQQLEQMRQQQEQARQQQDRARPQQEQRAMQEQREQMNEQQQRQQQMQEQQQRQQQQQMQERQRQAREQQQEQAERRAQRPHPPGRGREGD